MNQTLLQERPSIDDEPYPKDDGWYWIYHFYAQVVRPREGLRKLVRCYFHPRPFERWKHGLVYRLLGVDRFGRWIPTGGSAVRRLTGARMAPYTLHGLSVKAVEYFRYRTCVFEALHVPFFLTLLFLSVQRLLSGRADLALEDMLVNLVFNIYPIMHQRYTRLRIDRLLFKAHSRKR